MDFDVPTLGGASVAKDALHTVQRIRHGMVLIKK
jgi:hypothetical protein